MFQLVTPRFLLDVFEAVSVVYVVMKAPKVSKTTHVEPAVRDTEVAYADLRVSMAFSGQEAEL